MEGKINKGAENGVARDKIRERVTGRGRTREKAKKHSFLPNASEFIINNRI
jgi:hypothetical protein